MKTRKWPSLLLTMAISVFFFSSCKDWGQMDPPAGNQVYPKLEKVANYTFDEELDPTVIQYFAYTNGEAPDLYNDNDRGSVLYLNEGYARISNPLNNVKVQNAVSLTFWVKQAIQTDEETKEELPQDLEGALFSFQNENGAQRMFFTANGWLRYEGLDGTYEDNNPEIDKTGLITAGEWHFVAISVTNNGYFVYVDGLKKIYRNVTDFDCSKIVQFMASVPYLYIGYGSDTQTNEMMIDDLMIYRNTITKKEWSPIISEEGAFEYVVGDPILTVGATDNSSAWWTTFSNYFRIPAESKMNFKFTNHTNGVGNWNNWNFCLSTDGERDGTGYTEYFVIRSDLYGWGDAYATGTWTSEGYGDWDAFRVDMEGAEVTVTIERSGSKVTVDAVAKALNGNVYRETFTTVCGDGTQVVRGFFIMDSSHIVFDTAETSVLTNVPVTKTTIGAEDCSAPWWTEFSDYFQIPAEQNLHLEFENHTNGVGNWNNWNLCLSTDAERNVDGYAEYFVIRSDLYGWGDAYAAGTWTSDGYGDWDAFRVDMEGAQVTIDILRSGATVTVTAIATSKNGNVYKETFVTECGDGNQMVRVFLIVDGAYLNIDSSKCYLYAPLFK
ncbi:LamG-like jellyroll fold domain-containing protein [Bacteroides sp. 519]|uniref:LamG-like jellyroll fold domain-containing protein n=1 Tax=Bacteroides sp. 519 TaxID=2302937 RepID=UPI0013D5728D|nr:LamG-like jellyroll fold domain-containing protein [Bacteroides sp. 519]NDV60256.1 hypothetical protein [Bacteroides sp. 519]